MVSKPLLREDLDHVLLHTQALWQQLAHKRLFITGGTGFFGRWILESIMAANDALGCAVSATVLSRDPGRFKREMSHLASRSEIDWICGRPTDFDFPNGGHDYILHLATATSAYLGETDPIDMLQIKLASIRRVLDYASQTKARRLLVTSSGAVYGPQPAELSRIPESYRGSPDPLDPASAYGQGKRLVEQMCALVPEVDFVIARCFSFVGPHLPLDARFAVGNFLRDALAGRRIILKGNGQSVRSYLHAADLTIWLLTLLINGKPGCAYNVGSDHAVTTLELARKISALATGLPEVLVTGASNTGPISRYVPDITYTRTDQGLDVFLSLETSIERSFRWLRQT